MNRDRISQLFEECFSLSPGQRQAWLAHEPDSVRWEVERLLQSAVVPASSSVCHTGAVVGGFEVGGRRGAGGMGEIYLARDAGKRPGAAWDLVIKLIRPGLGRRETHERFFQRERTALAGLAHHGICRFIDGGVIAGGASAGTPYVVMELVNGQPITQYCAERSLSVRDTVYLFLQACEAIEYAHRNRVLHRDLHPGNILVTEHGQVKIIDFGLARLAAGSLEQTAEERPFCYPYSPPEHVSRGLTDTSSDVYMLGAVLFRLLTGQPVLPDPADSLVSVANPLHLDRQRRRLIESMPPPPASAVTTGERARQLRPGLDAVLRVALMKDKDRRYASVQELHDDLVRYLEGEPVTAVPDRYYVYWTGKYVRKHWKACLALLAAASLAAWRGTIAARRYEETHMLVDRRWTQMASVYLANRPLARLVEAGRLSGADLTARREAHRRFVAAIDSLPERHISPLMGDLARSWWQLARWQESQGQPRGCAQSARRAALRAADASRYAPEERLTWRELDDSAAALESRCAERMYP